MCIRDSTNAAYTIKGGEVVAVNGRIVKSCMGRTIWVDAEKSPRIDAELHRRTLEDLKRKFREYWTVEFENYMIQEDYLRSPMRITPAGGK